MRIDLRGENILNSKAEYSRCRVPRLRIDMEGWKEKIKEKVTLEERECTAWSLETSTESSSLLEEQARQKLERDVEESQEEIRLAESQRDYGWKDWKDGR